ncbi:uncharacterized protein LY89DRAFT_776338 [Mollisia scopiformis]|uniref:2EXR domain-containing protein n=1 Tax=Mollisia scopiformis TaxID=149040 RepID=A0A194XV25_MOLSC|nr:uncharacterized protein LY89DRAFT_776338 [Mollisia scopiformis]KUJ24175.1 hypothetical protein LY89DRAFT_776338 [Mollisia scopiformis]
MITMAHTYSSLVTSREPEDSTQADDSVAVNVRYFPSTELDTSMALMSLDDQTQPTPVAGLEGDNNISPPTQGPLAQFTIFDDLPSELRLQIWREAMSPRVLEIMWNRDKGYFSDCRDQIPALMHVCVESRACALEKYIPMIVENECEEPSVDGSDSSDDAPNRPKEPPTLPPLSVYIDPTKDTLYLSMGTWDLSGPYTGMLIDFLRIVDSTVASKLEHLETGFDHTIFVVAPKVSDDLNSPPLLTRFPKMKTLGMAVSDICIATPMYGADLYRHTQTLAPRRPALGVKNLDHSRPFDTYRWCPLTRRIRTTSLSLSSWSSIPTKLARWKVLLMQGGADGTFLDDLDIQVTEIVRGDMING